MTGQLNIQYKGRMLLSGLVLGSSLAIVSCSTDDGGAVDPDQLQKSIVILYENDVHCDIDAYTKIAGFRDAIAQSDTAWAGAVSCGDYLSGGVCGAMSKGKYIIDVMRNVGYTAITLGNHEFDFGTPRMMELLQGFTSPVVCANFFEYGATAPVYASYAIKSFGQKKVAFVGVCTPETMRSEAYAFFDENGKQLYDMKTAEVYSLVQQAVDKARGEGADYVVVLSHLGEQLKETNVYSHGLVAATSGIDVLLDGHSHAVIEHDFVKNKDGKEIIVSQTGTKFQNIGKLLITKDGQISTTLIPTAEISYTNRQVTATIDSVKTLMAEVTARKVATTAYDLTINGADGKRLVRSGETNLGNLVSDAFRVILDTDMGLVNGGGIRNSIPAGDITFGQVFDVLSFDQPLCRIEATGKQILAMLQRCTAKCPEEDGSFPQMSGIRFTVHTKGHTVSDVTVLDRTTGEYKPIDESKTYTICTPDYYASGGFYSTLKDCKQLSNGPMVDRDCVVAYLEKTLGGTTGTAYEKPQGRVTIVND